jgi:hypothetical protein
MTIEFEKLKARLLANPKVKGEYDALAPEFKVSGAAIGGLMRHSGYDKLSTSLRAKRSNPFFLFVARWIASLRSQ